MTLSTALRFIAIAGMICFVAPAVARAGPCDAPVYNQYDFFVGNWVVTHKDGTPFATDVVTKELKNCTVWERWNGSKIHGLGYSGYDAVNHKWIQAFFGDDGSVALFEGHHHPNGLLFTGRDYPKPGVVELNKVDFRQLAGGVVEEYWVSSTDGGKTWKLAFDGFFHRKAR